jgi:uncharacterized protein
MTQTTAAGTFTTPRGFAAMDPERQRELARKGGQAAHQKGSAHRFSATEAQAAGRKGGQAIGRNREYMAMIGKKGGKVSGAVRQKAVGIATNDSTAPNGS